MSVSKLVQLHLVVQVDLVEDLELLRGVGHGDGGVQGAECSVHAWEDEHVAARELAQHALPVLGRLSLYLRKTQSASINQANQLKLKGGISSNTLIK